MLNKDILTSVVDCLNKHYERTCLNMQKPYNKGNIPMLASLHTEKYPVQKIQVLCCSNLYVVVFCRRTLGGYLPNGKRNSLYTVLNEGRI